MYYSWKLVGKISKLLNYDIGFENYVNYVNLMSTTFCVKRLMVLRNYSYHILILLAVSWKCGSLSSFANSAVKVPFLSFQGQYLIDNLHN